MSKYGISDIIKAGQGAFEYINPTTSEVAALEQTIRRSGAMNTIGAAIESAYGGTGYYPHSYGVGLAASRPMPWGGTGSRSTGLGLSRLGMPYRRYGAKRAYSLGRRKRYSRKGSRKRYGRRRYKKSITKKVVGTAMSGARYSKPSLCKTLGGFFPNCVAVSFPLHITNRLQTGATNYNVSLRAYPYRPVTASANIAGATAFGDNGSTSATIDALGFLRLVGAAGLSDKLYSSCLCYKVKYKVRITPSYTFLSTGLMANLDILPPWNHAMFPINKNDPPLQTVDTDAKMEQNLCQVEVKHKYRAGTSFISAGATNTTPIAVPQKDMQVTWRGQFWPHKECDKPFAAFLADPNNWGTASAEPTIATGLQFFGRSLSTAAVAVAEVPSVFYLSADLVFYCLLKDTNNVNQA